MKNENKTLILIFLSLFFFILLGVAEVEAACCNNDGDCSGGSCACGDCSGCDCCPETCCCRYDGDCKIGDSGGSEDCLNKGFNGTCGAGDCQCTSDCPGGNGGNGGDTHKECDSDCDCVEVDGSGTDECDDDGDCYPCGQCIPCDCGTSLAVLEEEKHFAESFLGPDDGSSQVLGEKSFGMEDPLGLTSKSFLSHIFNFINNILAKVKLVII